MFSFINSYQPDWDRKSNVPFCLFIAEGDSSKEDDDQGNSSKSQKEDVPKALSVIELYAEREKKLASSKMEVAKLCQEIVENPEENVSTTFKKRSTSCQKK